MTFVENIIMEKAKSKSSSENRDEAAFLSSIKWWQLHKELYKWVLHWAQTPFGFVALILLALFEPICVPVPADVMVVGMSLGKPKHGIRYGLTCAFFSVLGGTTALILGQMIGGDNVIQFFDKIVIGPIHLGDKARLALQLYQKYDFWAIAISALTPVPYMLFSWLGGMAGVSILKFVAISLVFRSLRFGSEGLLFNFFGEDAKDIIEKHFNTATVVVMVLLVLVVLFMKKIGQFVSW